MRLRSIGLVVGIALLAAVLGDTSPSGFRCGLYLLSVGDSQARVLQRCGEPTNVSAWEEERIRRDFYKPIPALPYEEFYREPFLVKEYIRVEEWEYNLGPTRFVRYLRFENGRLTRVTTGDYGY